MARYKCVIIPRGDPNMRELQTLSSDGFWSHVAYIPRDECRKWVSRGLSTEIVASYVRNNNVSASELPALINDVHSSILETLRPASARAEPAPVPAVPIKGSVKPDYIVSLEDGRRYKSLRRHLSRFGLTPEAYRQKWQLPADYPMVAPNYSKTRAALAKSIGLGQKKPAAPVPPPKPSGRGKRK